MCRNDLTYTDGHRGEDHEGAGNGYEAEDEDFGGVCAVGDDGSGYEGEGGALRRRL